MATIDHGRRHTFFFLAAIGVVILFMNLSLLSGTDIQSKIRKIPLRIPLTGHNEQIADVSLELLSYFSYCYIPDV